MNVLCFDIETIPDTDFGRKIFDLGDLDEFCGFGVGGLGGLCWGRVGGVGGFLAWGAGGEEEE